MRGTHQRIRSKAKKTTMPHFPRAYHSKKDRARRRHAREASRAAAQSGKGLAKALGGRRIHKVKHKKASSSGRGKLVQKGLGFLKGAAKAPKKGMKKKNVKQLLDMTETVADIASDFAVTEEGKARANRVKASAGKARNVSGRLGVI